MMGVDSRCSVCISGYIEDFREPPTPTNKVIKGFNGSRTYNVMQGTANYQWEDDEGQVHTFDIPGSIYVPGSKVRLLSPQHWAKHVKRQAKRTGHQSYIARESIDDEQCILTWGTQGQFTRTIPLDRNSNVATFSTAPGFRAYIALCEEHNMLEDPWDDEDLLCHEAGVVSDDENDDNQISPFEDIKPHEYDWADEPPLHQPEGEINQANDGTTKKVKPVPDHFTVFDVTAPSSKEQNEDQCRPVIIPDEEERQTDTATAEMLQMHYDLGHVSFEKIRRASKRGVLPSKFLRCPIPTCSACEYARASKRAWRGKKSKSKVKEPPTRPGQVVGVDQLVSPVPGLVGQMTGFITKQRYRYATVFVDHYSGLGYVYLQKKASVEETLKAKQAFERYALQRGVRIEHYHADNGVFKAKGWVDAVERQGQGLTFAAVGAHHQNGKAERRIRELQETARAMLLHSHRRWPKGITANLWPYALQAANDSYNSMPSLSDNEARSPNQLFSKTDTEINPKHHKPFGSPIFVLDPKLQSGLPFHKWSKRARVGIYLGHSPVHARNVALVLDRDTGYVSPQFHVRFDKNFHTCRQINLSANWTKATGLGNFVQDRGTSRRNKRKKSGKSKGSTPPELKPKRKKSTIGTGASGERESLPANVGMEQVKEPPLQQKQIAEGVNTSSEGAAVAPDSETRGTANNNNVVDNADRRTPAERAMDEQTTTVPPPVYLGPTRSGRKPKPNRDFYAMALELLNKESELNQSEVPGEIFCFETLFPRDDSVSLMDSFQEYKAAESDKPGVPLYGMKAVQSDPDTMYYHQAMKQPDKEEFKQAMIKEVTSQIEEGIYSLVLRSDLPREAKVYPAVWQMKRKRHIETQEVKKHKARCNLDGSKMQKGIDFNFSYSAVASWSVIRIVLAMAVAKGWKTRQIDYVLAFPQAPLDEPLYMNIPRGVQIGDADPSTHVLKLHKNIYGTKFASRKWNRYLTKKLIEEVGFKQSDVDECLFYRGNVLYVLYTDDSILAGPDEDEIEQVIELIRKANLKITDEGDIQDFLGVNIKRKGKEVEFTQPQLINKILRALRFEIPEEQNEEEANKGTKTKDTPAATSRVLLRHADSEPHDESFNYRSVVGMLNYLTRCSRSDIAYAVHQCARFTADPKIEHSRAVRWLGRYLLGTRDKGMKFTPDLQQGLEVFVDADFCGTWDPKDTASRDTARSRYGYIVRLFGCPIMWKSSLQTEIALSTTEAEYTGLSYALRDVIPIIELLKEMKQLGYPVCSTEADIHCRVFEDNSGAVEIAREKKYRPRTKHLNVKLHHFRSYVDSGAISIHPISTTEQPADYLTKSLIHDQFVKLRKMIMGW